MAPWYHLLFLILLAVCMGAVLVWRVRGAGTRGLGLAFFFALLFGGLLVHQACWQLSGFGSLGFQKFQRRYDVRPTTLARTSEGRGRLLDRRGQVLAQSIPGQRWGHKTLLGPAGLAVVGYSSREYGLSGLERVFDARLCGMEATDLLTRPTPTDVKTTLDAQLQKVAFEALAGRRGAVVALNPKSGEILALVSSPSVEESQLRAAMKDKENAPLYNRATQGLYPPGSVFKLFSAALALDCNKAGAYACPGKGWSPAASTKPIRDTHPRPANAPNHTLRSAFSESSNIWFARATIACGWKAFINAANRCQLTKGFTLARCGERTYGVVPGQVPDLSETPVRLAYLGFGQGDLLLTPVHVAALTAAVANGGVLAPLHLEASSKRAPLRFFSKQTATRVSTLMQASVLEGTSKQIALWGLPVAGKTGTAENVREDHAWFTCFAPAEDPQIVVTVLVENGGYGAATALPIAKKVLTAWRDHSRR